MPLRVVINRQQKNGLPLPVFRFWNEECVVYNPLSGDAHLLPTLHAEILRLMIDGTRGGELIDRLVSEYMMSHQEAVEFSDALFTNYKNLGLIDPAGN